MKKWFVFCVTALIVPALFAHPHFRKTTKVTLPGDVEVNVSFYTVPANEAHAQNAEKGAFLSPGRPMLEVGADLKAGSATIPAGTYTVGAIKNSMDDWTMALYPGEIPRGESPDMSKMIKLDSQYEETTNRMEHLMVDITPGHGKFEGKAVFTIWFGSMLLDGLMSDTQ
jgi:hypothetical protein